MTDQLNELFALGTKIGQGQALGTVGYRCLAALSKLYLDVRESGAYKKVCESWDAFCIDYIGLSGRQVNKYIHHLQEYGEDYLRISSLIAVSPEFYNRISKRIQEGKIDINGELVAIEPQNATAIRDEIRRLRAELRESDDKLKHSNGQIERLSNPGIASLQARAEAVLLDIRKVASQRGPGRDPMAIVAVIDYCAAELLQIRKLTQNEC